MAEGDIDWDQKLDPDTRQRLLERNEWRKVQENDKRFPDTDKDGDPTSDEDDASDGDDSGQDGDGGDTDTPEQEMVKADLKAELDKRGVKYPSRASHADLVDLLKNAPETPED